MSELALILDNSVLSALFTANWFDALQATVNSVSEWFGLSLFHFPI